MSCSATSWRISADGVISGLGGCKIASGHRVLRKGDAWPRPPQATSLLGSACGARSWRCGRPAAVLPGRGSGSAGRSVGGRSGPGAGVRRLPRPGTARPPGSAARPQCRRPERGPRKQPGYPSLRSWLLLRRRGSARARYGPPRHSGWPDRPGTRSAPARVGSPGWSPALARRLCPAAREFLSPSWPARSAARPRGRGGRSHPGPPSR